MRMVICPRLDQPTTPIPPLARKRQPPPARPARVSRSRSRRKSRVSYTADTWPAGRWPNFSFTEMACQETGECGIDEATMDRMQLLRDYCGLPLTITSGYRSPRHSIEAAKAAPGTHSMGRAVDISCSGIQAFKILTEALAVGFTGIGVKQNGYTRRGTMENRFLHLDDLKPGEHTAPRPTIWSY